MNQSRSALFRGRHFRDDIIVLCVRWYLRYPLRYRDLEEMIAERGLTWIIRPLPAGFAVCAGFGATNPIADAPSEPLMEGR